MTVSRQENVVPFLRYDGRISDLYGIFIVNLLLTIVTLGIWRFWAVTRMRRYIWSRTAHSGERFEYDGTGGQLFVGFLMALGIILGLVVVTLLLSVGLVRVERSLAVLPVILFELAIVVLALGAPLSAQRYRLNHTLWRGIRGGLNGSMLLYGLVSLLYLVASVCTLYQLLPWMWLRLFERRTNASVFGTQRFQSSSRAMPLYLAWLGTFVALLALLIAVAVAFWLVESSAIILFVQAHEPMLRNAAISMMLPALIVAYLVLFIGSALIVCGFQARFLRQIAGSTTLGGIRFSSDADAGSVLRLVGGNLLILFFTLGFGLPIIIHRNQRFLAGHLLADGALNSATLHQTDQRPSRYGEGMFQALDAGAGIG